MQQPHIFDFPVF